MTHLKARGDICGLPDGHRGGCRSVEAVKRERERQQDPNVKSRRNERNRQQYQEHSEVRDNKIAKQRVNYQRHREQNRKYAHKKYWQDPELSRQQGRIRDYRRREISQFFCYAILFSTAKIIKIGSSPLESRCLKSAKQALKRKDLPFNDGYILWKYDIQSNSEDFNDRFFQSILNEHRLQSEISFFINPWQTKSHRMPEWFLSADYSAEDLIILLKKAQTNIEYRCSDRGQDV
jgi:hypothetical protein